MVQRCNNYGEFDEVNSNVAPNCCIHFYTNDIRKVMDPFPSLIYGLSNSVDRDLLPWIEANIRRLT